MVTLAICSPLFVLSMNLKAGQFFHIAPLTKSSTGLCKPSREAGKIWCFTLRIRSQMASKKVVHLQYMYTTTHCYIVYILLRKIALTSPLADLLGPIIMFVGSVVACERCVTVTWTGVGHASIRTCRTGTMSCIQHRIALAQGMPSELLLESRVCAAVS